MARLTARSAIATILCCDVSEVDRYQWTSMYQVDGDLYTVKPKDNDEYEWQPMSEADRATLEGFGYKHTIYKAKL